MESILYKTRVEKLVEVLKRKGIDGFIFGISVNMYYFTDLSKYVLFHRFL